MTGRSDYELKRLTRSMAKTLTVWKTKGGEPSLPDMAQAIQGWKDDLERLAVHDDLNSVSFQTANRKMAKAWSNRDTRKVAIEAAEESYEALASVSDEIGAPEPVKSYEVRNRIGLYGDEIGRYAYEPNVFGDLHEISRQIAGFQTAPSPNHIDYTNMLRVKAELREVAERYPYNSPIHHHGSAAVKSLDLAQSARNHPTRMRQYFSQALENVNEMGAAADIYHSPVAYKAQLVHDKEGAEEAIADMEYRMYSQPFESPEEFISGAIKAANRVIRAIAPYYDPKASRLAQSVKDHLEIAEGTLQDARVKSIGQNVWNYDQFNTYFEEAMNRLSDLDAYVRTLA